MDEKTALQLRIDLQNDARTNLVIDYEKSQFESLIKAFSEKRYFWVVPYDVRDCEVSLDSVEIWDNWLNKPWVTRHGWELTITTEQKDSRDEHQTVVAYFQFYFEGRFQIVSRWYKKPSQPLDIFVSKAFDHYKALEKVIVYEKDVFES